MPESIYPLKSSQNAVKIFVAALMILNIALFIRANTWPIGYEQVEIAFHKMFWSMDSATEYTLHTGMRKADLLKPFASRPIDGEFRSRQFSYLMEMLPFKISQQMDIVDIRNYFLIMVHLTNAILLGFLVFYLSQNKLAGMLSGFMLLNSGIALMTLAIPFRNAKLLVMTFFLLGWLMITSTQGLFFRSGQKRLTVFFLLFVLAFFTDEYSIFLFLFLLLFIWIRDGREGLFNGRILASLATAVLFCIMLGATFLGLSQRIDPTINLAVYADHFHKLGIYYQDILRTIKEIFYAFFFYFLPRNFGYWGLSGWGMAALAASIIIFWEIGKAKHPKKTLRIAIALLAVLLLKNLLVPHNNDNSYHPGIIPEGVNFPSLLFFDLYYVYCEAVLLFLAASLLLSERIKSIQNFSLLLALFSVISTANFVHIRKSSDFMNDDTTLTFPKVIAVKKYMQENRDGPLYLSFPSGNNPLFKRSLRQFDPSCYKAGLSTEFEEYATSIPVYYLRAIERGRVIISLNNARKKADFHSPHELVNAQYFLDVPKQEFLNLRPLKEIFGISQFEPKIISQNTEIPVKRPQNLAKEKTLIFFVKGGAQILFASENIQTKSMQSYGQSYQVFQYPLSPKALNQNTRLLFQPIKGQSISLVGPFIIGG